MVSQDPEITILRCRLIGGVRYCIGIAQAILHIRPEQFGKFFLAESQAAQVKTRFTQGRELVGQQVEIPFG